MCPESTLNNGPQRTRARNPTEPLLSEPDTHVGTQDTCRNPGHMSQLVGTQDTCRNLSEPRTRVGTQGTCRNPEGMAYRGVIFNGGSPGSHSRL
eukprot:659902-Amorphochlora_amoeboformis.AAC.1